MNTTKVGNDTNTTANVAHSTTLRVRLGTLIEACDRIADTSCDGVLVYHGTSEWKGAWRLTFHGEDYEDGRMEVLVDPEHVVDVVDGCATIAAVPDNEYNDDDVDELDRAEACDLRLVCCMFTPPTLEQIYRRTMRASQG